MNFYEKVTVENASEWYRELPLHLRKRIDEQKIKYKNGCECARKECPEVFDQVVSELGKRPLRPADPIDPLDGWTLPEMEQFELHKAWGARYDQRLLERLVLENAEGIQRERRLLNEAIGVSTPEADGKLPAQWEGLDPTVAATIRWLQETGEMPLEFLASTYRNDEVRMSERIAAARVMMEFAHRKIPVKIDPTGDSAAPKLNQSMLRNLTEKDLEELERLLSKVKTDAS